MTKRSAPSRHDRKGVKPRRARADAEPDRVGLVLPVKQAKDEREVGTFCAHTPDTLPAERTNPRPTRGATGRAVDVEFVHVVCRCGTREVPVRADIAAAGWVPRCSMMCELAVSSARAAEVREGLRRAAAEADDPVAAKVARTLRARRGR